MAGHSKWANIQHRKGRQDKLRSKLFSKLSKDITIAAKLGGGDIDANPRLRLAVSIAKGQSVPKDNIQRAIDKAAGGDADSYEDIRYEGFGPGGVAIVPQPMSAPPSPSMAAIWARPARSPSCSTMSAKSVFRSPWLMKTR